MISRRHVLQNLVIFLFPFRHFAPAKADSPFEIAMEGYIFQQYAQRNGKRLPDVIAELLPMARAAGFHSVELNPAFFTPEIRDRTLALLRTLGLQMPSIYVGGPMHSRAHADRTIAAALAHARLAAPFGCKALVHNPDPKPGGEPKSSQELVAEADGLNRMAGALRTEAFDLRVHHHTPQLENHAREWRYLLAHTDPELVGLCVDVDWAYEGGFEPVSFLREAGRRLCEIHVRSARDKIWLEDVEDSDIDYRAVAAYLKEQHLHPLVVMELAYRAETVVTRSLEEDLRRSRIYTEAVFGNPPSE
jgi:inosose dehydratase